MSTFNWREAVWSDEFEYKYNEDEILAQIHEYIVGTYDQHYSLNKFQAAEFIIDAGYGVEYCLGNILKYTQRYGRKGNEEDWRKDLIKVIHYAIIAMHAHDERYKEVK